MRIEPRANVFGPVMVWLLVRSTRSVSGMLSPHVPAVAPPGYTGAAVPDLTLQFPEPDADLPEKPEIVPPEQDPGLTEPTTVAMVASTTVEQPQDPLAGSPPRPDDFWASLNLMHSQLSSFDVAGYLNDETKQKVAALLGTYENDLTAVRDDLSVQFESNVMKLSDIQSTYASYLSTLRSQAMQTEATEQQNLRAAVDEFAAVKTQTSTDTQQRLHLFADLMPESRSPAGLNRDLVGFTVSPVEFSAPDAKNEENTVTQEPLSSTYETYLWIAIWVLAGLLIVTLLSYLWTFRRRKRIADSGATQ